MKRFWPLEDWVATLRNAKTKIKSLKVYETSVR